MKRLLALALALPFVLAAAGPAAAYTVLYDDGSHGTVYLDDTIDTPAGTCKYGEVVHSNWAYLQWMKVRAPHVFAADRNSETRQHRVVTWQWKLQRKNFAAASPTWKVLKSSPIQRKTAYEDAEAPFTAMTINYDAEAREDPNHLGNGDVVYRALVIIKWFKPNGDVEATVKLAPTLYRTLTYWDASPHTDYCQRVNTDG